MPKSAITDLEQQIEAVRREAFAAGYAAAMEEVRELASRSAPQGEATAAASSRRGGSAAAAAEPAHRKRSLQQQSAPVAAELALAPVPLPGPATAPRPPAPAG